MDKDGREQPEGTSVESNEDQAHAITPAAPELKTEAKFNEKDKVVFSGATVNDTVTYSGLVAGKSYTLEAQLIDKADGKTVLGSGEKTFTADKSGNGEVEVAITVTADLDGPVAAAVAFETLMSADQDAVAAKASDEVLDGPANEGGIVMLPETVERAAVIAVHHDINDAAQTVTSDEGQVKPKPSKKPEGGSPDADNPENNPNPADAASDEPKPIVPQPDVPAPSSTQPKEEDVSPSSVTEEPTEPRELKPSISTSVSPKAVDEIVPGGKVIDTVSYEGLKPNMEYTLNAEMRDKDREDLVIGSGEKTFTTPKSDAESVSGKVDVEITFNANAKGISSAVAFEELTSMVVDAKGKETPDAVEPNTIAVHQDINDVAQTVTTREKPEEKPVPGTPKLELKKYIGTQEFTGEEKPQDQPGADGVVDAQDEAQAFVAKEAGQDLTVTFVVTNTGDLDLKGVSVADELIAADTAGIQPGSISPASQDIKKGESATFTAKIKAPEAGKLHADEAKATGVPVDENGKEIPWVDENGKEQQPGTPVDSNKDLAHATTPKPQEKPSEPAKPKDKPAEPAKPGKAVAPKPKPGKAPKITTDAAIEGNG
ncbi:VaFE repeat-containing surface-anchored protein, partial [Corynebacterium sp. zg-331]|uniref:VaFE repeat-containing surface-anchored protein n=1 Tax=unclassified Corynebacterium TaxID=2624378 RepID=UPI0013FF818D|nr:VaFE repeat-containing surface-anchored protein [Corynebacterium sp. zg-331]MPV53461.1 VaFE repeat-containing surface-anchored protein [Corynebacterium sp. zg331]